MSKLYSNIYSEVNLYSKKSLRSPLVTQMIFGETFSIIKKNIHWLKIKIKEDGYTGYIRKRKFNSYSKPTHKIYTLSANFYKNPDKRKKLGKLTFGSKIKVDKKVVKFSKFGNKWIENKDIKPIQFTQKNIFFDIKIFKNIKYLWGGKSYRGIDCSALVQLFLNFNNKFCPRDAKDQIKFLNKNVKLKNIKKNDIIYWKGHVAIALSKTKLIHAYGPLKRTVVMDIKKTIDLIKRTAKLNVILIKRI